MSSTRNPLPRIVSVRVSLLPTALLVITTGCRVGPDYHRPTTPVPDAWHQQLQSGTHLDANGVQQWWTIFGDPTLDSLVVRAKEQNLDLNAALHRIYQSREQLNIARSARWAQVDGTGAYQNRNGFAFLGSGGDVTDLWSLGLDVAWEPDVWGRVRRDVESNCATYQSTVEAYRDLMVTMYSDVATNYVNLRTFQARLGYARQNVEIQRAALELAELRVEGGVSPILDVHQANANLAGTEAEIPPLESSIQQSLNRLAVLLGEYPRSLHCELLETMPIPTVPLDLPTVLPCDVVRQRPDIRQAERNLAANTAQIGVATADLYPQFAINGSFGLSALFTPAGDSRSYLYSVGPSVRWPIFQAGRIRASIASSESAVCEALATYEHTLLQAAEEVENSIVSFNNERERLAALERSVAAAKESLDSVLEVYRAGNTDFQNVLDTQRTLFTAQNQLAASEGQVVVNLVSFYKALGGGWDPLHHCQPRCVRLACPPDCPTEAAVPNVGKESYLDNDDSADDDNMDDDKESVDNESDEMPDNEPDVENDPSDADEAADGDEESEADANDTATRQAVNRRMTGRMAAPQLFNRRTLRYSEFSNP